MGDAGASGSVSEARRRSCRRYPVFWCA